MAKFPDDEDGAALAELAADGIDLSLPLQIDFPVVTLDETEANAVAKALKKAGYDVRIEYEPGSVDDDGEEFEPGWSVIVTRRMTPEYKEIVRVQAEIDMLADPYEGCSDGWEVLIDGEDGEEDEE